MAPIIRRSACSVFAAALLFISCASKPSESETVSPNNPETAEQSDDVSTFIPVSSLDDIVGHWESAGGSYFEYEVATGGRKYLLYCVQTSDDTVKWQLYCRQHALTLDQAWSKRFACLTDVYGSSVPLPAADMQDVQHGIRIEKRGGHIYGSEEYLIPERILAVNLSFFRMAPDRSALALSGTFHFMSDLFSDITAAEGIRYEKK